MDATEYFRQRVLARWPELAAGEPVCLCRGALWDLVYDAWEQAVISTARHCRDLAALEPASEAETLAWADDQLARLRRHQQP